MIKKNEYLADNVLDNSVYLTRRPSTGRIPLEKED